MESFAAEFGCFVNDGNEVLRTIRIYTNDGKMAATTTMAEKRAADAKVPVPLCASLSTHQRRPVQSSRPRDLWPVIATSISMPVELKLKRPPSVCLWSTQRPLLL